MHLHARWRRAHRIEEKRFTARPSTIRKKKGYTLRHTYKAERAASRIDIVYFPTRIDSRGGNRAISRRRRRGYKFFRCLDRLVLATAFPTARGKTRGKGGGNG